ncbi:MAG: hypothetical protein J5654_08190 [Victivallales bacterium]|nr:hypothetical protein [Victivallales bacterium]
MAENTPKAEEPKVTKTEEPKVTKANLIKNLIFALFIIVAIFFCFSQFNKSQKLKDLNRAIELLNQAREANPVDFGTAREVLAILDEYQEADFSNNEAAIAEYVKTKSLCYSTIAEAPDLDAKESEQYMMKAYALDETNPDVPDALRAQFQGLTQEERMRRADIKQFAQQAAEEGAKALERAEKGLPPEVKETAEEAKEAVSEAAKEIKEAASEAVEEVKEAVEKVAE